MTLQKEKNKEKKKMPTFKKIPPWKHPHIRENKWRKDSFKGEKNLHGYEQILMDIHVYYGSEINVGFCYMLIMT